MDAAEARQAEFSQRLASAGALGAHAAGVLAAYAAIQREANAYIASGMLQTADATFSAVLPILWPSTATEVAAAAGGAASDTESKAPVELRFFNTYAADLGAFGRPRLAGFVRDMPSLLSCEPYSSQDGQGGSGSSSGGGGSMFELLFGEGPPLPQNLQALSELSFAVALGGGDALGPSDVAEGFFSAEGIRRALIWTGLLADNWELLTAKEGAAIFGAGAAAHVRAVCDWAGVPFSLLWPCLESEGAGCVVNLPFLLALKAVNSAAALAWLQLVPGAAAGGGIGAVQEPLRQVAAALGGAADSMPYPNDTAECTRVWLASQALATLLALEPSDLTAEDEQEMEKLATMIQAGQIACVNHDWRSKESAPFASVQERFPLTAFDARCVLSEYYHRRGDVNAALGWAREGLACWYRFASVSITGPSAVEDVSAARGCGPFFFKWADLYHLAADGQGVEQLLAVPDGVWLLRNYQRLAQRFTVLQLEEAGAVSPQGGALGPAAWGAMSAAIEARSWRPPGAEAGAPAQVHERVLGLSPRSFPSRASLSCALDGWRRGAANVHNLFITFAFEGPGEIGPGEDPWWQYAAADFDIRRLSQAAAAPLAERLLLPTPSSGRPPAAMDGWVLKARAALEDAGPRFLLHARKTLMKPERGIETTLPDNIADMTTSGGLRAAACLSGVTSPLPYAYGTVATRARVALNCGLFEATFALSNLSPPHGVARMAILAQEAARCGELTLWERLTLRCASVCNTARDRASFEEFAAAFEVEAAAVGGTEAAIDADAALRAQCLALLDISATARAIGHGRAALLERGPLSASAAAAKAYGKLLDPSKGGKLDNVLALCRRALGARVVGADARAGAELVPRMRRSAAAKWVGHLREKQDVPGLERLFVALAHAAAGSAAGAPDQISKEQGPLVDVIAALASLGAAGRAAALRCAAAARAPLPGAVATIVDCGAGAGGGAALADACGAIASWGDEQCSAAAAAALDGHVQGHEDERAQGGQAAAASSVACRLLAGYAALGAAPGEAAARTLLALAPPPSLALALALRRCGGRAAAAAPLADALVGAAVAAGETGLAVLLLRAAWAAGQLDASARSQIVGRLVASAAAQPAGESRTQALLALVQLARTGVAAAAGGAAPPRGARALPGAPVALPHDASAALLQALASETGLEAAFDFVTSDAGGALPAGSVPAPALQALVAASMAGGSHERAWALARQAAGAGAAKLADSVVAAWEAAPAVQLPQAPVLRAAAEAAAADAATAVGPPPYSGAGRKQGALALRLVALLAAAEGSSPAAAALELGSHLLAPLLLSQLEAPAASETGAGAGAPLQGLEAAADLAEAMEGGRVPLLAWQQVLGRLGAWEARSPGGAAAAACARLSLAAQLQLLSAVERELSPGSAADGGGGVQGDDGSGGVIESDKLGRAMAAALECPLLLAGAKYAAVRASRAAGCGDPQLQQRLAGGWAAAAERAAAARARLAAACASAAEAAPGHWLQLPPPPAGGGAGGAGAAGAPKDSAAAARRLAVALCVSAGRPRAVIELYLEYRRAGLPLDLEGGLLEAALAAAREATDMAAGPAAPAAVLRSAQEMCPPDAIWVPAAAVAPGAWRAFLEAHAAAGRGGGAGGGRQDEAAAVVGAVVELLMEAELLWSAGGRVAELPPEAVEAALRVIAARAPDAPAGAAAAARRLATGCSLRGGVRPAAAAGAGAAAPEVPPAARGGGGGGGKRKGAASAASAAPASAARAALPPLSAGILSAAAEALVAAGDAGAAAELLAPVISGAGQLPAAESAGGGEADGPDQQQLAVSALLRALQAGGRAEAAARAAAPLLQLLAASGVTRVTSWPLIEALGDALDAGADEGLRAAFGDVFADGLFEAAIEGGGGGGSGAAPPAGLVLAAAEAPAANGAGAHQQGGRPQEEFVAALRRAVQ
ncbi:hypothetical protein Rsub_12155 [Raphidocelis subcapitata]|uniref:Uncharacterized protein n=1 Tax=Raphidocelis subcapitata TaxID=307507 RepID=A0A2V0PPT1_9CHLO|nr:hypothetical protein Rsub_12155 [Raphidocelis subcapitata]|eukprot:GBF99487.1 hypothetical protein Rsub_12155 [Raphidocelis subcapitata]